MMSIKCIVVGDEKVGKTSLLNAYTSNDIPSPYTPTVYDSYSVDINTKGKAFHLGLWDSSRQEEYD